MRILFTTTLLFLTALPAVRAQVEVRASEEEAEVTIEGKPFTTFFYGPGTTKPYLHPLRTAAGTILTREYPMAKIPGEPYDHPHHRGRWFSFGEVNDWDFWANDPGQKGVGKGAGKIVFLGFRGMQDGKKSGMMKAAFSWKDGTGEELLAEEREMRFSYEGALRMIDFDITLKAARDVHFGDTKEGMFAIRLKREMDEQGNGTMRNAEGLMKEKDVWGKKSPWVDYTGKLGEEAVGVAILDHPQNPRHPTYWHSRAYGLFAANPIGLRDFTRDKTKDGTLELAAGKSLRFRYRVVIHGEGADIGKLYAAWTGR